MIRIRSNTRVEIGRFFRCLAYAEQIAHDCARRQARMSVEPAARIFLIHQAGHEAAHARVFGRVASIITPRGAPCMPPALQHYRTRLEHAARRGDFLETLVGQQLVLEGLGDVTLKRLSRKLDQRRIGFKRLRQTILHQEQGHQAFGERTVGALIEGGDASASRVRDLIQEYLFLADRILDDLQPVFDVVGADAAHYRLGLRRRLPSWAPP